MSFQTRLIACILAVFIIILFGLAGVLASPMPQDFVGPSPGSRAITPTATSTPTRTATASTARGDAQTATPTPTATATRTATPSQTPVPSVTPTMRPTWTAAPTKTPRPQSNDTPLPATDAIVVATSAAAPTPAFVPQSPLATVPPSLLPTAPPPVIRYATPLSLAAMSPLATPVPPRPSVAAAASPLFLARREPQKDVAAGELAAKATGTALPTVLPTATGGPPRRSTRTRTPGSPILARAAGSTLDPAAGPSAGPRWLLLLGAILTASAGLLAAVVVRTWRASRS